MPECIADRLQCLSPRFITYLSRICLLLPVEGKCAAHFCPFLYPGIMNKKSKGKKQGKKMFSFNLLCVLNLFSLFFLVLFFVTVVLIFLCCT